ncbi:hypothetical protein FS749_005968 [Ceratobasidium sp. UAMH 11750]|nr:hypothetical protein FS749_005968 [Ceratobasidium sp. UAMH 11750]
MKKRHVSTAGISLPASKRVRLAAGEEDDTATQSESEEENWNTRRRPDTSDSDSDSNTESQPPTTISRLKLGSQRLTLPKSANPKSAPPSSQPSTRTKPSAPAKTSNTTAAPKRVVDPTSYLAAHPLPNDLNDIDGLAVWALKFAEERAQALDQGCSTAGPSRAQEPGPSATADHIARSIANHRSRLDNSQNRPPQPPPQSTRSNKTTRDISNDDEGADTEDEDAAALPRRQKVSCG